MKVTGSNLNKTLASGLEGAKSDKVTKSSDQKPGKSSAGQIEAATKLNLSQKAQQMQKAKEIASRDLDGVDEAKVAKFQNLIDSGKYKVDAEAVADRLVDEHLLS
ncbi:MAG: flagellar biosynthesis anti-sigma factor FlgM [Bdellovibrionaceae bacterium]|nr:flagellar biosynthesis anti-sigma factor FlgM [Pseudobdellovibrionaceae bacterium]|tara:strand:+ start:683 stop:997 length:315 start_codon:yes stop_codon:yes gene_type:complete